MADAPRPTNKTDLSTCLPFERPVFELERKLDELMALSDATDMNLNGELRPLLHPYLHWHGRDGDLRGRSKVLAHLLDVPTPRPPAEVEIRDGQVYRWSGP